MLNAIVFDLDGVVYRGERAMPGVADEISRLQKKVKVLFLTNNATKSRADYVRHLGIFRIDAGVLDIMTSSFGVACYIKEKFGKGKKVFIIGEQGLKDEIAAEAGAILVEGQGADIVACGLDRGISYAKLESALANLLSGAAFVLANNDPTFPHEGGVSPGSGAIAAPLIVSSGRQPDVVIGKPSAYLLDELLRLHNIKPSEAAFVGDRLDIDIRMANKAGMKSVLVLTGIAKKGDVENAPESDKPALVVLSAAEVGEALGI